MNLKGKVIVLVGGNGLIGKETFVFLRKLGAFVYNADLQEEDLDNFKVKFNICDDEDIERLISLIIKRHGRIDGMVNTAYPRTEDWGVDFDAFTMEAWRKNIDYQLNSSFYLCKKTLEHMKKQNYGSIINIASIYGVVGNDMSIYEGTKIKGNACYSAIKGGMINLTRYLAAYFGKYNIRVNCISPGGVFDNQEESFVRAYEKKVPLKRMAQPNDIIGSIAFLLSDHSKYITGHNLLVDGGWTIV